MNKYGGQKLPGRWARVKNKKNSVLMNPRRPGGVPAVGDRGTRGRWGCLTLKNSGFILFQLNKNLKSCTGGRNMAYGLASTSPPVHQSLLIL